MLHEVLLALAGHPSPILEGDVASQFPLITSTETALLSSLGRLATLHRALKSHLPRISAHHPSLICRALANSIIVTHLSQFQKLILETEQQILSKSSASVGAYDIVPLVSIVGRFEPWKSKLEWYWDIACFMYSADADTLSDSSVVTSSTASTGPEILNKLRLECRTGYPDIETAALTLTAVAEVSWIRQLSNWLIYQPQSAKAADWDFFVGYDDSKDSTAPTRQFLISPDLIPSFVTIPTANSILFVGRTIQMLQSSYNRKWTQRNSSSPMSTLSLRDGHAYLVPHDFLRELAKLASPIIPAAFSALISSLRTEIATKLINEVFPLHHFIRTLTLMRQFLLAGRSDFMDFLISEADNYILHRHAQSVKGLDSQLSSSFVGVVIKEAEVSGVLLKTWTALAPDITKGVVGEDEVEWAREHLNLKIASPIKGADAAFEEFLFPIPTILSPRLESTFDLFIAQEDLEIYSKIHSYLLAIRRGHNHLSGLWRQTWFRRHHPAPIRRGRASKAFAIMKERRRKANRRTKTLRGIWSTCNGTICALTAIGDYLVGEVVEGSWKAFHSWATQSSFDEHLESKNSAVDSQNSKNNNLPRDPEVIGQGHRQYLATLFDTLLMSDQEYMKVLKTILVNIDQVVALVKKLGEVQKSLDLYDEGVMDGAPGKYRADENETLERLAGACKILDEDLGRLKDRLQHISTTNGQRAQARQLSTGFEAYSRGNGLDRLSMRLEKGKSIQANTAMHIEDEAMDV